MAQGAARQEVKASCDGGSFCAAEGSVVGVCWSKESSWGSSWRRWIPWSRRDPGGVIALIGSGMQQQRRQKRWDNRTRGYRVSRLAFGSDSMRCIQRMGAIRQIRGPFVGFPGLKLASRDKVAQAGFPHVTPTVGQLLISSRLDARPRNMDAGMQPGEL